MNNFQHLLIGCILGGLFTLFGAYIEIDSFRISISILVPSILFFIYEKFANAKGDESQGGKN